MTDADPIMARISDALDLFNSGRRSEAREEFAAIWAEIELEGDPFHQCVLSHYMADAQNEPREELAWDRRALAAADRIAKQRPDTASLSMLSLYPSLHLNLADVLHRLGEASLARAHLQQARQASDGLVDDSYGRMIRDAIERLAGRISQTG
jgi:hypothetical protein